MDAFAFLKTADSYVSPPSRTALTCLVTIHGIGFQRVGYADKLHTNLRSQPDLTGVISESAIYVVGSATDTAGLAVLDGHLPVGGARLAHIALIYSPMESNKFDLRSFFRAIGNALLTRSNYVSWPGLARLAVVDGVQLFNNNVVGLADVAFPAGPPSLRVREDKLGKGISRFVPMRQKILPEWLGGGGDPASGLGVVIKNISDDVCAYLYRTHLRDNLRKFVHEAFVRLAENPNIAGIIVNSHSQGTVIAFDVLSDPALRSAEKLREKVKWFMTAGSPLRKYARLFGWPDTVRNLKAPWTNFWDLRDPVADPLAPPANWRPSADSSTRADQPGLYSSTTSETRVTIVDWKVDNLTYSSLGSLRAHNYWDNVQDFVGPVAKILNVLSGQLSLVPTAPHVVVGRAGGVVT